ncbi:MAG: hypothetical protein ACFE9L_09225 [Candidatus Hodarchaeota archaeon]
MSQSRRMKLNSPAAFATAMDRCLKAKEEQEKSTTPHSFSTELEEDR